MEKAEPLSPEVCICHTMAGFIAMKLVSFPMSLAMYEASSGGTLRAKDRYICSVYGKNW
jgi:hypothetical protein